MLALAFRRTSSSTRVIAVVVAAALAGTLSAGVALTHAAKPKPKSTFVFGKLVDHRAPEGCPSPLCNAGTYLTGKIRGPFLFVGLKEYPTGVPGVMLYVGMGTIHTPRGDIRCEDSGVLNTNPGSRGEGVHLCEIVGGTRYYEGATGYIQERFFFRDNQGYGDYRGMIRR
jgi:hypothetical protein